MKNWGFMLGFIFLFQGCASAPMSSQGDEVDDTIEDHAPAFASCGEQELKPQPGKIQPTTGSVVTRFVIGKNGKVILSEVERSDFSNPRLHDCLLDQLNQIRFNVGSFTAPLEIRYPFTFTQANTRRF